MLCFLCFYGNFQTTSRMCVAARSPAPSRIAAPASDFPPVRCARRPMLGKILRCAPSRPRANALRRLRSSAHTGALALRSRDTLNNLITKSPQSWQTSVALPFFNIQGTVIEWDECAAALAAAPLCPARRRVAHRRTPRAQDPLRRPPDAARAVRGRVAHADFAAPSPP